MCKTILESLDEWAKTQPDKVVWTFLDDHGAHSDSYTYKELQNAVYGLANHLLNQEKIKKSDRILLVFFPGLQFMVSLLACFAAGIIAVPVFPPDPRKLKKDLHHFISIQSSSGAKVVLTHSPYNFAKKVTAITNIFKISDGPTWPDLKWISVDDIIVKSKAKKNIEISPLGADHKKLVAFLQYTSGSTSEPKGVMITHGNLAHNETLIMRELRADQNTVNISWLPQYHDMGLIGSYLGVLYCGGCGFYCSPISFLKDPLLWLKMISKHRGTHTQAPNFAYALSTRKYKEQEVRKDAIKLDLSSMEHMINAAEPIDQNTINIFIQTFKSFGLNAGIRTFMGKRDSNVMTEETGCVVSPTYGLAESTVFVCGGGRQRVWVDKTALESNVVDVIYHLESWMKPIEYSGPRNLDDGTSVTCIVGCGFPLNGENVDLRIVNADTLEQCEAMKVGEIWANSPSKASGYWGLPEASVRDFHAKISGGTVEYLRTGDMGFLFQDELFVCGRLKDLIIVGGTNHYPQDIERTAEACAKEHLRPGCSAAFSIKSPGGEKVIYVAEVKDDATPVDNLIKTVEMIIENVTKTHGLSLATVCLLKTRSIPKTTSGKIARSWCRRGFQAGTLEVLYEWVNPVIPSGVEIPIDVDETVCIPSTSIGAVIAREGDLELGHIPIMPPPPVQEDIHFTKEQIKGTPMAELINNIEDTLRKVAMTSSAGVPPEGFDKATALAALGLDSMTVVQFKGVLEKRYYFNAPDEFMFSEMANLTTIAEIIQRGGLSTQQKEWMENGIPEGALEGRNPAAGMPTASRQPLCPWFTCCY